MIFMYDTTEHAMYIDIYIYGVYVWYDSNNDDDNRKQLLIYKWNWNSRNSWNSWTVCFYFTASAKELYARVRELDG